MAGNMSAVIARMAENKAKRALVENSVVLTKVEAFAVIAHLEGNGFKSVLDAADSRYASGSAIARLEKNLPGGVKQAINISPAFKAWAEGTFPPQFFTSTLAALTTKELEQGEKDAEAYDAAVEAAIEAALATA